MTKGLRFGFYKTVKVLKGEKSLTLDLPKIDENKLAESLPTVSVITLTRNRGEFAGVMLYNWINIVYPRDKLEWIILDDSDKDYKYNLQDYIPIDKHINYVKLDKHLTIGEKRNLAISMAKNELIAHMDDDDYYFPDSILAKVRVLLHYNVQGVFSLSLGLYDLETDMSVIYSPKRVSNAIPEASMLYRKSYWNGSKFGIGMYGESVKFIGKNFSKWIDIPFWFNIISITHGKNITKDSRRFQTNQRSPGDFNNVFPEDFKTILQNLKILKNKNLVL